MPPLLVPTVVCGNRNQDKAAADNIRRVRLLAAQRRNLLRQALNRPAARGVSTRHRASAAQQRCCMHPTVSNKNIAETPQ